MCCCIFLLLFFSCVCMHVLTILGLELLPENLIYNLLTHFFSSLAFFFCCCCWLPHAVTFTFLNHDLALFPLHFFSISHFFYEPPCTFPPFFFCQPICNGNQDERNKNYAFIHTITVIITINMCHRTYDDGWITQILSCNTTTKTKNRF